ASSRRRAGPPSSPRAAAPPSHWSPPPAAGTCTGLGHDPAFPESASRRECPASAPGSVGRVGRSSAGAGAQTGQRPTTAAPGGEAGHSMNRALAIVLAVLFALAIAATWLVRTGRMPG